MLPAAPGPANILVHSQGPRRSNPQHRGSRALPQTGLFVRTIPFNAQQASRAFWLSLGGYSCCLRHLLALEKVACQCKFSLKFHSRASPCPRA